MLNIEKKAQKYLCHGEILVLKMEKNYLKSHHLIY